MFLKKYIVSLLLITLLLLAACGGSEPATTETPAAAATATKAPPAEPTATEAPVTEADPTEEPAEEAAATEEPAEEAAAEGETASYVVDTTASTVTWFGSKPIGASETGSVNIAEGTLNFAGDQLVDGTITIDMATIATTSQSGGFAEQLVGHLSSDDFFGVETYPTAKLVLKSAEPTGTDNQYKVTADLTIKETTKELEFVTDVTEADGSLNGSAEIIINRADFDVRYGSGSFFSDLGDNLISDEMTITVALVAKKM